jgi:hypothetical protein
MRFVVVALNLIAGVLMGVSVLTVVGPDSGTPRRGPGFTALWLAFHVGPLAALAALALVSRRLGFPRLPRTLVAVTVAVAGPGVLMARSDAAAPPDHSPGHGVLTFLVVCVQYLVVGAVWIGVFGTWAAGARRARRLAEPGAAAGGAAR